MKIKDVVKKHVLYVLTPKLLTRRMGVVDDYSLLAPPQRKLELLCLKNALWHGFQGSPLLV